MPPALKVLVLTFTVAVGANAHAADDSLKFGYQVFCSDQSASKMMEEAIRVRFDQAHLQVTDRLPAKKLLVYAQQDVGSKVNKSGWSIAIAHATNQVTYFAASKLMPMSGPGIDDAKPALVSMLNEQGFLSYLNVAHVDELTSSSINELADNFVGEFARRVKQ